MSLELALAHVAVRADMSGVANDVEAGTPSVLAAAERMANRIAGVFAQIGVGLGIYSLIGQARGAIAEAEKAIGAEARLGAVLDGSMNKAGFTREQLFGMAEELSKVSKFDGTAIKEAMTALGTYGIESEEKFRKILTAAMDVEAVFGGSLVGNVQAFGNALQQPDKGLARLTRSGFIFTTEQQKMIKNFVAMGDKASAQAIIWDVISGQEGAGSAGISPAMRLRKEAGDLAEELGRKLIPIQEQLIRVQNQLTASMIPVIEVGGKLFKWALDVNEAFGGIPARVAMISTALAFLAIAAKTAIGQITTAFITSGWGIAVVAIGAAVGLLTLAIQALVKHIMAMPGMTEKWNIIVLRLSAAWEKLLSTVTKVLDQIAQLALGVMGINADDTKYAAETIMDVYADMALDMLEWMTVLFEAWGTLWDNMGSIAASQGNKITKWLVASAMKIGTFGQDVSVGQVLDAAGVKGAERKQAVDAMAKEGITEDTKFIGDVIAGKVADALVPVSADQRKTMDEVWAGLVKRKAELEEGREGVLGTHPLEFEEKIGDVAAAVEDFKATLDDGRFSFSELGNKFQDAILKKESGDKVDQQIDLQKQGLAKQDELIAAVKGTAYTPALEG